MTVYSGMNLTQTYTTLAEGNTPSVGTVAWVGNSAYKFVQYETGAGAVAAVAGNVCYYYAPGGVSAGSSTVVTSDLSDSAGIGAGVLQAVAADGAYCWIQIKGPATLTPALTAGGDGANLTPTGAGDGTLDAVDTTSALTANVHVCAYAIDASAKIIQCDFPF